MCSGTIILLNVSSETFACLFASFKFLIAFSNGFDIVNHPRILIRNAEVLGFICVMDWVPKSRTSSFLFSLNISGGNLPQDRKWSL
jgi:hypothetical protein